MNALCLLSKSFLSRLLLETLAKYRVPVHASKELRALLPVNLSFVDEARAKALLAAPDTVVYSNAEDSLPLVYASGRKPLVDAITVFKDKAALREKLRAWFPDFFFAELTRGELAGFHVPAGRTLFLKPSIGFCGRGNARVSGQAEWDDAVPRVLAEISAFQGSFNDAVLNADKFLVEDFIEGEEFACDAFFDTRGKPAVTHFQVIERYAHATLLRCRLETGRTHQIRVHLQSLGHPLVGDRVYGRNRRSPDAAISGFARQALHAERLEFLHPASGKTAAWQAPLPADIRGLIAALRAAHRACA